jgi:hypothetical protein
VNEAPVAGDAAFVIDENSAFDTVVGTVPASDPDGAAPNNQVQFAITSGNELGAFAIDAATGQITVADPSALDREARTGFNLVVTAADLVSYDHDGSETSSDSFGFEVSDGVETFSGQSFAITVNPVNDAPVAVIDAFTIDEDMPLEVSPAGLGSVDKRDSKEGDYLIQDNFGSGGYLGAKLDVGRRVGVFRGIDHCNTGPWRASPGESSAGSGWRLLDHAHRRAVA